MTYSKVAKHQEDLDLEFGRLIDSQLGGEDLYRCIQCGTCSGICPLSVFMDHTPRQIMAMTRAGFRDDVLSSNTPWLCASCYACTVECPKEIKITDVMYAIKREAIRRKVYPKRFPVPVLAKEFYKSVRDTGRSNEGRIVTKMFLKTDPRKLAGNALLGVRLMRHGRMALRKESMAKEGLQQLQAILEAVEPVDVEAGASQPTAAGH